MFSPWKSDNPQHLRSFSHWTRLSCLTTSCYQMVFVLNSLIDGLYKAKEIACGGTQSKKFQYHELHGTFEGLSHQEIWQVYSKSDKTKAEGGWGHLASHPPLTCLSVIETLQQQQPYSKKPKEISLKLLEWKITGWLTRNNIMAIGTQI